MALAGLLAACDAKQAPTTDPAWTYQVAGDSVTYQAIVPVQYGGGGGDRHGANTDGLVGIGWEAKHAQPRLDANVADPPPTRSPRIFTFAFGHNYSDHYGQAESNELLNMAFSVHDTTCVVVVLPHRTGPGDPEIQRVRTDLVTISNERMAQGKPTVRVDWRSYAQPEDIADDHVHLSDTDADGDGRWDSAVRFAGMLWDGHEQCEAML